MTNESITLQDLADGKFTVVQNLSPECQRLYYNVAGPNIELDSSDFRDFSKAVERSCTIKGCIGWNMLDKKAGEFGKERDFNGTYLRITLGMDLVRTPILPPHIQPFPC